MKRMRVTANRAVRVEAQSESNNIQLYNYLSQMPKTISVGFSYETVEQSEWHPGDSELEEYDFRLDVEYIEDDYTDIDIFDYNNTLVAECGAYYIAPGELEIDNPHWGIEISNQIGNDQSVKNKEFPYTLSPEEAATAMMEFVKAYVEEELASDYKSLEEERSSDW